MITYLNAMHSPKRQHAVQPTIADTPFSALNRPKSSTRYTLLSLECGGESSDVVGQLAVVAQELDIGTVDQDLAGGLLLHVLLAAEGGEAPVLGDDDLLAARELVLRATESLESGGTVCHQRLVSWM